FDTTLAPSDACGARALNGAMLLARQRGLQPHLLDLRNSGDTAGDRKRVVGYASLVFVVPVEAPAKAKADDDDHATLGRASLTVARNALAEALGQPAVAELDHPALDEPGASFVTLRTRDGELRGCIGRLEPERPLREDLRANAYAAGFRDNRFEPLRADEWPVVCIEVSLLGPLSPLGATGDESAGRGITEADALARMRPGEDGIVLSWRGLQATLLPQVWQSLPTPAEFLNALKRKAGLRNDFWDDDVRLQCFAVRHFDDEDDTRP
ncbi:MAG TPA: AmmeMemoRadiSam system protein A, partial [Ideonella sp.]|nr:AmmeMemoRadiSam system protein A [Ideonella sp.]